MSITLAHDQYGKGGVRLVKVTRHTGRHEVADITVAIRFEGAFEAAYTQGDNRRVLPTDTMKNTVYVLARDHPFTTLEAFGLTLAEHFLQGNEHLSSVGVDLIQRLWYGIYVADEDGGTDEDETVFRPHPHAFMRDGREQRTCAVQQTRTALRVGAGLRDLHLLKTAQSGFSHFLHDALTTLQDADDRLLGTDLSATWQYAGAGVDFAACLYAVRQALLETFARHDSLSVQHTLYAMGRAALEACPDVTEIHLAMPNKHRLPVDLTAFGRDNPNTVFVSIDEPFGVIEATLRRA